MYKYTYNNIYVKINIMLKEVTNIKHTQEKKSDKLSLREKLLKNF